MKEKERAERREPCVPSESSSFFEFTVVCYGAFFYMNHFLMTAQTLL